MKTNFIMFKSCSNLACEQKLIESRDCELASVQVLARQWGQRNKSTAVEVCVETIGGGTVVSRHVVAIDQPAPKPVLKDVTVGVHLTADQINELLDVIADQMRHLEECGSRFVPGLKVQERRLQELLGHSRRLPASWITPVPER